MIQLDFGDHRPLYEQIKDKIKELIINGVLSENESIPSVRELASNLAINPNTIQKAYKELESEGYIYSLQSKGSFVAPRAETKENPKTDELLEALDGVIRELKFLGAPKEKLENLINKIYREEAK